MTHHTKRSENAYSGKQQLADQNLLGRAHRLLPSLVRTHDTAAVRQSGESMQRGDAPVPVFNCRRRWSFPKDFPNSVVMSCRSMSHDALHELYYNRLTFVRHLATCCQRSVYVRDRAVDCVARHSSRKRTRVQKAGGAHVSRSAMTAWQASPAKTRKCAKRAIHPGPVRYQSRSLCFKARYTFGCSVTRSQSSRKFSLSRGNTEVILHQRRSLTSVHATSHFRQNV